MKHKLPTILAALAILTLASCKFSDNRQAALTAADVFHQQYNEAKFAEIYKAATPDFQKGTTEAQFIQSMRDAQRQLGKFLSSSRTGLAYNTQKSKNLSTGSGWQSKSITTVAFTYQSQFERGAAVEKLTFEVSGEKAQLQECTIEPSAPAGGRTKPATRPKELL